MANLGSALTGQEDPEETPLKDIVTSAGSQVYDKLLGDPASRSALLQIGLQMMQRPGFGSGTGEHIAQSIGAGGEAVQRIEDADLKRLRADDQYEKAQLMARIAQQNADSRRISAEKSSSDTLSNALRYRMEQDAFKAENDFRKERQTEITKKVDEPVKNSTDRVYQALNKNSPQALRFVGKPEAEIRATIEAEYDAANPKPPSRAQPQTVPAGAQPSKLPPVSERVIGKTKIPKKGGGNYVWQGQGWGEEE